MMTLEEAVAAAQMDGLDEPTKREMARASAIRKLQAADGGPVQLTDLERDVVAEAARSIVEPEAPPNRKQRRASASKRKRKTT